jgi:protein gp37
MSTQTSIEWTNHTFAPWFGCTKISPACDLCYAEDWSVRRFHKAPWGNHPRVRSSKTSWNGPLTWQRKAEKTGSRSRVFCSQLSDVFDNQVPNEWRDDLWKLIARCPNLIWLLLTKRPQNIRKMLPGDWPWPHVWLGVTAENQAEWNRRVSLLAAIPAAVRFISAEPLLEQIDPDLTGIDWVICGGETDPQRKARARIMEPVWARSLLASCRAAGVPFFLKQMTDKAPIPADLFVREWPR